MCTCIYEKKSEKLIHFFLSAINQGSMLSTRKNFGLALFHPKYASYLKIQLATKVNSEYSRYDSPVFIQQLQST